MQAPDEPGKICPVRGDCWFISQWPRPAGGSVWRRRDEMMATGAVRVDRGKCRGGVPERPIGTALKAVAGSDVSRGFESRLLRPRENRDMTADASTHVVYRWPRARLVAVLGRIVMVLGALWVRGGDRCDGLGPLRRVVAGVGSRQPRGPRSLGGALRTSTRGPGADRGGLPGLRRARWRDRGCTLDRRPGGVDRGVGGRTRARARRSRRTVRRTAGAARTAGCGRRGEDPRPARRRSRAKSELILPTRVGSRLESTERWPVLCGGCRRSSENAPGGVA